MHIITSTTVKLILVGCGMTLFALSLMLVKGCNS